MSALSPPVLAAVETAIAHGHEPDRKEILQDGNTLVLRLSETLVARVLQDRDGPRRGAEWFARENAVALHLAAKGAPVIPMHPDIPPGPHMHRGYPINFWSYVTDTGGTPEPEDVGRTLFLCHESLRSFEGPLEDLAILHETVELMPMLERRQSFAPETLAMLRRHLDAGLEALSGLPFQALHGDAHYGNLMVTADGLLWTDWEDAFRGPVEWDLASIIWNTRVLDGDRDTADRVLRAYREAGGDYDEAAVESGLAARAAVMCAWYPILYPDLSGERGVKLRFRLDWLAANAV